MNYFNYADFNLPGLSKVEYQLLENVLSISNPDVNNQVMVNLKPGIELANLYFTKTASDSKILQKEDDSGIYYKSYINLINPGLTPETSKAFALLAQKDMIFILSDRNGNKLLIGTKTHPARMKYKISIPATSRPQRTVTIDSVDDHEPYFVMDSIVITSGGFSAGFSDGFNI